MKFLLAATLVTLFSVPIILGAPQDLNVTNLLSTFLAYLAENSEKHLICGTGYKFEATDNHLGCVKNDSLEALATNIDEPVVANNCPSWDCPSNPTCNPGYELLIHGENCCCVKDDLAELTDEDENFEETTDLPETTHAGNIEPTTEEIPLATDDPLAAGTGTAGNLAPPCPAHGCPVNPHCDPGWNLLTHDVNCCCIREFLVEDVNEEAK